MSYKSVVLSDSPSVLWMLNEASGTTAADATGNGYTGTYNGTITLGSASIIPSDNADTSMECTNSSNNGVILETTTPPTTATSAWSLEGCILTPAIAAASKWEPVVINGGDGTGGGGYGFGIGNFSAGGGFNLDCLLSGVSWHDSGYALAASTKYHIVLVYTSAAGGTLTWYVNGSNVVTQTGVGTPNTPVYTTWTAGNVAASVGCDPGGAQSGNTGRDFGGTIQAAAIYPTSLTSTQVTAHYNAYAGTTGDRHRKRLGRRHRRRSCRDPCLCHRSCLCHLRRRRGTRSKRI